MDRQFVYYNQIPLETDILNAEKNAYVALSKLATAIIGNGPAARGFSLSYSGMTVTVGSGEFYSMAATDSTAYSSLSADSTLILKQAIAASSTSLTLTPSPALTAGQSVVFLVQVALLESDINPAVLAYFNPTAPYTPPLNGPAGSGSSQPTLRNDAAVVSVLQGAASSGTPVAPSPSEGAMGLYTVTVSFDQATISSGNITPYAGATLLTETLAEKISLATGLSVFAALDSPSFVGTPTAPTAAQFDDSTIIATTAYVRGVGYNASGVLSATATGTLSSTVFGGEVAAPFTNTGAITLTLPVAATSAIGQGIFFINNSVYSVTLVTQGSDSILLKTSAGQGSLVIGPGDNVLLSVAASGFWHAPTGTAVMGYSNQFANSQGANGWQLLPSGLLLQWGVVSQTISSEQQYTIVLSTSNRNFTTAVYSAQATSNLSAASGARDMWMQWITGSSSTTQLAFYAQSTGDGSVAQDGFSWFAVGK